MNQLKVLVKLYIISVILISCTASKQETLKEYDIIGIPDDIQMKNAHKEGVHLYSQLKNTKINFGDSDETLKTIYPSLLVLKKGDFKYYYSCIYFGFEGVTLVSKNGRLIYANYHTCSSSETYFEDKIMYQEYCKGMPEWFW